MLDSAQSIENFFSKKVTVVITTRTLPSDASAAPSKENNTAARTTTHRKAPKSPRGNGLHRGYALSSLYSFFVLTFRLALVSKALRQKRTPFSILKTYCLKHKNGASKSGRWTVSP